MSRASAACSGRHRGGDPARCHSSLSGTTRQKIPRERTLEPGAALLGRQEPRDALRPQAEERSQSREPVLEGGKKDVAMCRAPYPYG